jgi:hypothetical protein
LGRVFLSIVHFKYKFKQSLEISGFFAAPASSRKTSNAVKIHDLKQNRQFLLKNQNNIPKNAQFRKVGYPPSLDKFNIREG